MFVYESLVTNKWAKRNGEHSDKGRMDMNSNGPRIKSIVYYFCAISQSYRFNCLACDKDLQVNARC